MISEECIGEKDKMQKKYPLINEGGGLLVELSLYFVRRALRRNQLSELSFFRDNRALRLHLQGFPCTLNYIQFFI